MLDELTVDVDERKPAGVVLSCLDNLHIAVVNCLAAFPNGWPPSPRVSGQSTPVTYGHLFPGQEADAVGQVRDPTNHPLIASGASDSDSGAQRQTQLAGRDSQRQRANQCDSNELDDGEGETP